MDRNGNGRNGEPITGFNGLKFNQQRWAEKFAPPSVSADVNDGFRIELEERFPELKGQLNFRNVRCIMETIRHHRQEEAAAEERRKRRYQLFRQRPKTMTERMALKGIKI